MNDIKVVVLAAGKSKRMERLAMGLAHKSLLPLGSKKILDYAIDDCVDAGVRKITMVVSDECSAKMFRECLDGIIDADFVIQHKPLGLGHAIAIGAGQDIGARDVLVILPDDVIYGGATYNPIRDLINRHASGGNTFLTKKVEDPSRWGIVEGGILIEKPESSISNEASVFAFILANDVVKRISNDLDLMEKKTCETHYSGFLNSMISNHLTPRIHSVQINEQLAKYLDCGTIAGYKKSLQRVLNSE